MKRKKTRKKIELVILIILLLSCAAIFINNYLVPAKLKNFTRNFLTTALNKPVFFENISFSLIKGVTINNITIFKTSEQKDTFLKAKSISFSPLLLPVIKKKFIISRLLINELALNLERMSDGKLDILDMPPSPDKENKEESFPVIITDITLKNSNITFTDNFLSAPQVIYLENISANAYFSLPAKVKFNFKTSVKDRADEISLKGNYYLQDKHLALTLNCIDLNLHQFNDYFKDKFPISIAKDTTDIAADIFFDIGKTLLVDGTIYFNDSQTNFISLALDGDFVIRGKLIYDFINKTLSEANGNIVLRKNNLKGLLYVDALEEIEGDRKSVV